MRRLLGLSVLFVTCASIVVTADEPRAIIESIGFDQNLKQQVPLDIAFNDETGTSVPLKHYFGKKPVILALVYYRCPMLCGAELNGLVTCLRTMNLTVGKDFEILIVSFNPDESPALAAQKKAEYVKLYGRPGAEAGWHFLTGNKAAIDTLAQAVGFRYRFDEVSAQYAHPSGIILLTPPGVISRYYFGVEYYPRDLELGLVEASRNKIGSMADQFVLYCYRYDPLSGRYGLVILNVLRLGGIATVLLLGTFMVRMYLRDLRVLKGKAP